MPPISAIGHEQPLAIQALTAITFRHPPRVNNPRRWKKILAAPRRKREENGPEEENKSFERSYSEENERRRRWGILRRRFQTNFTPRFPGGGQRTARPTFGGRWWASEHTHGRGRGRRGQGTARPTLGGRWWASEHAHGRRRWAACRGLPALPLGAVRAPLTGV